LQASKSRAAQEKLAELEKGSAPFADQLVEAGKFIGADLDYIGRSGIETDDSEKQNAAAFHGKEEWLLRWLLKKLQSQKDAIPRKTPTAWRLLCHILQAIPVVAAARILQERKFVSILRQTLEEAQGTGTTKDTAPSEPEEASSKGSRKRKRSGELVTNTANSDHGLGGLLEAIYAVIAYMQLSTKPNAVDGRGAEFSAEAMRSVLRTTAEEAAKILGLWLAVSRMLPGQSSFRELVGGTWLSRFVQIWELHTPGIEDLMQFSLYCSQSLIALLQSVKSGQVANKDWVPVLEELVARNIMLPAKAARADDPESDLLGMLTRVSIIRDSANAPLQFEIAIRSIQPQGPRRRRPEDETWLQAVFNTLVAAMLPTRYRQNSEAIRCMLQSAIHHKVGFELPVLRSITSTYALPEGAPNWELLHTIIMLDANVFLIPDGEKSLLEEVLTRITSTSLEPSWPEISRQVVADVVLPLMNESANARDLSGFIRHWHTQLVEFERLRNVKELSVSFSAWEDEALQSQLSKLLEPSLTLRQITEILDFLEEQIPETPNAVCVLLEAIAGSITREEVVDSVQLRLYHIMFDNDRTDNLNERYDWRSWRVLTRMLSWATNSQIEELATLWKERPPPFDTFLESGTSIPSKDGSLLVVDDANTADLGDLEYFRSRCAAWGRAEEWGLLRGLAKAPMLESLHLLAHDVISHVRKLRKGRPVGEEVCGSSINTERRGVGWTMWSCLRCVFVEYPTMLE
jgi:nucleolar pre-ribosomal-associated protein 2